ncbi:glycoside hydrolase family 38 C-terminal domain-containing protein [uncultured Actinomyces sp.]|jgi:putative alpha-mannosidase|uniref:alpha-mannosidase n=1 Tax=uncultured Actinomyces sp. TaxID=249061 RepID=UPI0028D57145|nr:glycoside hydrolase family 38 C-terminal domain-containing protein [uncultured Actinomyces sp.]
MHDNKEILMQRVTRTLKERILPFEYTTVSSLDVSQWRQPLEDGVISEPVRFKEALQANFVPFELGQTWGGAWQTTWFKLHGQVPTDLSLTEEQRLEVRVDLGFEEHFVGFHAEALVRDVNGKTIKALNPRSRWLPVAQTPGSTIDFVVEAAANPLILGVPPFQPTLNGDKLTASHEELYHFRQADLVIVNKDVYGLALDIQVLHEMIEAAPHFGDYEWNLLFGLNRALDCLDLDDVVSTAGAAREVLKPFMEAPALPGAHRISAVGHAHIDSAWLWPLRETRRKVNRTLANVVRLIEDGSSLIFALPAAQHAAWLKEDDPELFERVRDLVAKGRIVPVGGMWVEPDAVLPGGEAMCRQLVEGLDFFENELGASCQEIWLPDSFGYSAALPQIAREAGIERFLTQKISWNQVNTFPHHTLLWEGIDGSRIFTHFPPMDTYGAEVTGQNLTHAVENFKDKGHASVSLMPFGYGDGGGGPTREMLERIDRFSSLRGAPEVVMETPKQFFDRAREDADQIPVWVGELYLELHRGTFTSQIDVKQGNRRGESILRETELWCSYAAVKGLMDYPYEELRSYWRTLLLCQFHDILPGTSIAWVYREVRELHQKIQDGCEALIQQALAALTGTQETGQARALLANASSFPLHGVSPLSAGVACEEKDTAGVHLLQVEDGYEVTNSFYKARISSSGELTSLRENASGREWIPAGQKAGEFHIHQDFPNMWDAWDLDPFYRNSLRVVSDRSVSNVVVEQDRIEIHTLARVDSSTMELVWIFRSRVAGIDVHVEADWHEHEKLLKLAIPVEIHTDHAQYETQMGYITRATHENTSWDAYRFEVSAHRWVRLENASRSWAIANDSTYGWDVTRHQSDRRGTWSQVRATLVKSARFPDPQQDQGHHEWNFRIVPDASVLDAVAAGQQLNLREREVSGLPFEAPFSITGAVVESVAMAPDRSGDLVLRVYEAQGGPSQVTLTAPEATSVTACDLRYRPSEDEPHLRGGDGQWSFDLSAFQITTLRLSFTK